MTRSLSTFRTAALTLAGAGLLTSVAVRASTPEERALLNAPMPHLLYHGGKPALVHRATLQGYVEGEQGNTVAIEDLKRQVAKCTRALAASGRTLHPPTQWPDHLRVNRDHYYSAANRSIHYSSGLEPVVSYTDCALVSVPYVRAKLASAQGVCMIDLVARTAKGDCGRDGHAGAPLAQRAPGPMPDQVARRLAANPAFAALLAQPGGGRPAGIRRAGQRSILGVRCTDWVQPVDERGTESTVCYATGGSFVPPPSPDDSGFGGLPLEITTPGGFQLKAVDARLDTVVDDAVFTPYAQPGFVVNPTDGAR